MNERQKFSDIFQKLNFGIKPTRTVPTSDEPRRPLRFLPEEEPSKKCRKSIHVEDPPGEQQGIKLFSDSATTIESSERETSKNPGLTEDEKITKIRQLNHIYTWGAEVPDPFIDFKDLQLPKRLLENIEEAEFSEPTPIQMQAVSIMLNEQNLLANAPTGSGKTLAFIIPILKLLLSSKRRRVNSIILSPTNILAQQIYVQFLKFSNGLPVKIVLLEPGVSIENADILIATPYKFIYSLKQDNLTSKHLSYLRWLILDECDRLFEATEGDRNFRLQFQEVYSACSGSKTKLAFFSATFSPELERWCKDKLEDPAMICIGHRNSANSAVKQELFFTGDENGKLYALEQLLKKGFEPPALIFLQSKERAGSLFVELQARLPTIPIRLISSELTNVARDRIMDKFRSGQIWVLISTEMLGRGLDILNVSLVVNFDLPTSIISYIHRVGRTGRAGRQGRAITFYSYRDLDFIRPIATIIDQAGFSVPDYTLKLENVSKKQKRWLLKHAPDRRNVGSIGRWRRVKRAAMKDRIIKRDPTLLRRKKRKKSNRIGEEDKHSC